VNAFKTPLHRAPLGGARPSPSHNVLKPGQDEDQEGDTRSDLLRKLSWSAP